MFDLILSTVGEEELLYSSKEKIFSYIMVRIYYQKCLQRSKTKASVLVSVHDKNSDFDREKFKCITRADIKTNGTQRMVCFSKCASLFQYRIFQDTCLFRAFFWNNLELRKLNLSLTD